MCLSETILDKLKRILRERPLPPLPAPPPEGAVLGCDWPPEQAPYGERPEQSADAPSPKPPSGPSASMWARRASRVIGPGC